MLVSTARRSLGRIQSILYEELALVRKAASSFEQSVVNALIDIRNLDLSHSLLPSWDVVAAIVAELPGLQSLALK